MQKVARDHGLLPRNEDTVVAIAPTGQRLNFEQYKIHPALNFYYSAALQNYDLIDLAELGGLDPDLIKEKLAISQLYIPLRCFSALSATTSREVSDRFIQARNEGSKFNQQTESLGGRLCQSFCFVVLADPGAGKSTFIRWLATSFLIRKLNYEIKTLPPDSKILPKAEYCPIVISCRTVNSMISLVSFQSLIYHSVVLLEIPPEMVGPVYVGLWQEICAGNALILIDGLDEISDTTKRQDFVSQINSFASTFRNIPIVVTSRIYGYAELAAGISGKFDHVMISPLNQQQKDAFADRWMALTESADSAVELAERLKSATKQSDSLEVLSSNPLMLTTIALVLKKHGNVPENRSRLYQEAVDLLLRWRSRNEVRMDDKEALPQLSYLAYKMTELGEKRMREDTIINIFDEMRMVIPRYQRKTWRIQF